jgi:hypothetical protein
MIRLARLLRLALPGLLLVSACGPVHNVSLAATPAPAPVAETAAGRCSPALLPSGFTRDDRYGGEMTSIQYSASADVQAALEYDQYQSGYRTVFIRSSTPRAGEVFASCVSMLFAGETEAARFLSSYRSLRAEAGSLAATIDPGKLPALDDVVAYHERDQDFHAYGLRGTDVVELAARSGPRLFITTVAGADPSLTTARTLANTMVSG